MSAVITDIYRYPVKSMAGHSLSATAVGARGIPGDRCWTLLDEARGSIKGGKHYPALMGMSARLQTEPTEDQPSPPATITLPDGRVVHSTDPDINHQLSEVVGASVSLWPLVPADNLDHYRRTPLPAGVDPETAYREVFARQPDEPLPDVSAFPAEVLAYESPPGTYFDAFPLLVISTSALQALQSHRQESQFDMRRFRPNIVVHTSEPGFAEDSWAGRTARLGSAVLKFEMACPRCVMTTHGFDDLPKDPGIMRALVQANQGNLGIYANVVQAGTVSVGDKLALAP